MKPPDGIGGLDPRKHASPEVGERNVDLAAEAHVPVEAWRVPMAEPALVRLPQSRPGMNECLGCDRANQQLRRQQGERDRHQKEEQSGGAPK